MNIDSNIKEFEKVITDRKYKGPFHAISEELTHYCIADVNDNTIHFFNGQSEAIRNVVLAAMNEAWSNLEKSKAIKLLPIMYSFVTNVLSWVYDEDGYLDRPTRKKYAQEAFRKILSYLDHDIIESIIEKSVKITK